MNPKQQAKLGAMGLLKKGEPVPFNKESLSRVPHKEGHYEFWHGKKFLYIGVAGGFDDSVGDLHHRLLAYQEKDSYSKNGGHHSKKPLRDYLKKHEGSITIKAFPESIEQARLHEHQKKPFAIFNQDNQINEEKNHGVAEHHQKI